MKKLISIGLAVLVSSSIAFGQEEMQVNWKISLPHSVDYVGTGLEGKMSYGASSKEMTVYRTEDGSVVWSKSFKELAPQLRKIDELIPFWESDCVFLFERKMGKDQIVVVDLNTGKSLWSTDKYQKLSASNIIYIKEEDSFAISLEEALTYVRAKTGEEVWKTADFTGVIGTYLYNNKQIVAMNILPSALKGLFKGFKNQIAKINLANGEIVWQTAYVGLAEKKILTGERLYELTRKDDKLFLYLNGIQVYDMNTGASLWKAAYEETPHVINGPMGATSFGVYGAVAKPVIVGNDVYVVEFNKRRDQKINKYDLNTGKLLWTSPEIKNAKALPALFVTGDKVVVQVGGVVETHAIIVNKNSDGSTTTKYVINYPNVKPNGLQAFNTSDGSFAWQSEKFKKGITNSFVRQDLLYVCSGKALYAINPATGEDKYEINVMDDGIGNAVQILDSKDKVAVIGEKGIGLHSYESGQLVNSNKYKKSDLHSRYGDFAMMKTEKSDIACFDLNTGTYREFNAKKDATTHMSIDGRYVYVYQKKDVYKLNTF